MIQDFYKDIKIDKQFFIDSAKHVIEWNAKARQGVTPDFTNEMFVSQLSFLREELREFRDAAKINNHVEMLDAAADIFVVASYLVYMFVGEKYLEEVLSTHVGDIFDENVWDSFLKGEENIQDETGPALLSILILRGARDTLVRSNYNYKKVLKAVLKSNDSKYPTRKQILELWNTKDLTEALSKECKAIEERSASREEGPYTGVHFEYNKKQKVYVFWSDNKKIMKPGTFVPPNIGAIIGDK